VKAIVCIRQVAFIYVELEAEESIREIEPEKVLYRLNPYDEIAAEEAVRIKERHEGWEVDLITVGPARAEAALRSCFALGADRMMRLDGEVWDPWLIAATLANVIRESDYDLVLCGKKAIDTNDGLVGAFLAELLGIGYVSRIVGLEVPAGEPRMVVADRYLGRGDRQRLECALPALFTVEKGLNEPRYPTLLNRLRAEREQVEVIPGASIELDMDEEMDVMRHMKLVRPRPRPKKVFTPETSLTARERMRLLMSGHAQRKEKRLLEGRDEDIARKILEVLVEQKVIRR
jgi:electron transfer flavoprotein beta subunit